MRYFIALAYNGTRFFGWQKQPKAASVQELLEAKLSLILRQNIEVTGCGRTDTGVHASYYWAHFDAEGALPPDLLRRLNGVLGADVAVYKIVPVANSAHARFDAHQRRYAYYLPFEKSPFLKETAWYFPLGAQLDREKMQAAARLIQEYTLFAPFCKTHSDAKTMVCHITEAYWSFEGHTAVFHIAANRFLRGMVRLIVGACVNIGLGQMTLEDLREALEHQQPLKKSYSVPPTGLFLTEINYPYPL